jgi:hypothetical protein
MAALAAGVKGQDRQLVVEGMVAWRAAIPDHLGQRSPGALICSGQVVLSSRAKVAAKPT